MKLWLRRNAGILLLLSLFLSLGIAYSIINPLYEAPDELRHYRFVRYLVSYGALPVQGQEACRSQSHHTPLFYAAAAVATFWVSSNHELCHTPPTNPFWAYRYWEVGADNKNQYLPQPENNFPWHGDALAAHLARWVNLLIGGGTVWLTWAMGRIIFPKKPIWALGGAAFLAFNPMFVYLSGAINNDVMAAFGGAVILLACLGLVYAPNPLSRRWGFWLGGALGLGVLSKLHLLVLGVLIAGTLVWVTWQKKEWQKGLELMGITIVVAFGLSGWWFVRNQLVYGEPTGVGMVTELWGVRDPWQSFGLVWSEMPQVWSSLWGRFGYGQIPLPDGVYTGIFVITLLGLSLVLLQFIRQRGQKMAWLVLFLAEIVLIFGMLFGYMLISPAGAQGRFLFPALPALSILLFYSWQTVWERLFPLGQWLPTVTANAGMFTLALVALTNYLAPAYSRPADFSATTPIPNQINAQFDFFVQLRGYQLSTTTVQVGKPIEIELYWQVTGKPPGDYLLFLHLIDEQSQTIIAQRDTHPGLGNFPASQWQEGDHFVDRIRLYLPETAYAPNQATIQLGLYVPNAYRVGITNDKGETIGDALPLTEITIQAAKGDLPNPQNQNFDNQLRLVGYDLSSRRVRPGEELIVTLFWEAMPALSQEYLVQLHLVDPQGVVVATADHFPNPPMTHWQTGQVMADTHIIPIDVALLPNFYQIQVALLDTSNGNRQNIVAQDGHWLDDQLLLPTIRLEQ